MQVARLAHTMVRLLGGQLKRRLGESALFPVLRRSYWEFIRVISRGQMRRRVGQTEARFWIPTWQDATRVVNLAGEEAILWDFLTQLEPTDVVWDVGANIGCYSIFAGCTQPDCTIVAIEPQPKYAERIRANAQLNDISVKVVQAALSDTHGEVKICREDTRPTFSLLDGIQDPLDAVRVPVVPGDHLIATEEVPAPTVLKIDIEGVEMQCLRGLERTLRSSGCRLLLVEIHPHRLPEGVGPECIRRFLEACGFLSFRTHRRGAEVHICARKDSHDES